MSKASKHTILISLGSNIDKKYNTALGLDEMSACFGDLSLSSVYESESVGFSGENFYNLVALAQTKQSVDEVCHNLKAIEAKCGRVRSDVKFSSRCIDLDLLIYDDLVCDTPVVLPRDEIRYNAFVLQPMAELVPEQRHPVTGETYAQMWADYDKTKQELWPVAFAWSAYKT